jgi:hypothetical protein
MPLLGKNIDSETGLVGNGMGKVTGAMKGKIIQQTLIALDEI